MKLETRKEIQCLKYLKKPEKIGKHLTWKGFVHKLNSLKEVYTKSQVNHDRFQWSRILSTQELGPIYHMDFSENLTQMYKYEPQSSHFNKQ